MVTSQINYVDINFDDEVKTLLLLLFVLDACDIIVSVISSCGGYEKLKFDEFRDVILNKRVHKSELGDSSVTAFGTEGRRKTKQRV